MVTKEQQFGRIEMTLDDEISNDEISKYCSIFLKHESNPHLRQLIRNDLTFVGALSNFYDLDIEFSFAKINWENCSLRRTNPEKQGTSFLDLNDILTDFIEDCSERERLKKGNLEEKLAYEIVRKNVKLQKDSASYQELSFPILFTSAIFGSAALATRQYIPGVALLAGSAFLTYKAIKTNNLLRKALSEEGGEKTSFEILCCSSNEADRYLKYYKAYKAIKDLEVPR